jgi:hypothetical protein
MGERREILEPARPRRRPSPCRRDRGGADRRRRLGRRARLGAARACRGVEGRGDAPPLTPNRPHLGCPDGSAAIA